jgi:cyclophilin family peptidyl-prolyl cis-trans isomerase
MILKEPKILPSGVTATWSEVVRTEMDYNNKSSKATVYYYLDEQAFLDGKEPVFGEVIDVPYVEQEELEKSGVTAKTVAEEAMVKKVEAPVEVVEEPVEEVSL